MVRVNSVPVPVPLVALLALASRASASAVADTQQKWVERAAFAASAESVPASSASGLSLAAHFVGETSSAVFPVPNATNAATQFDSFFPDASVVGFAGPTPTGDEAELIATATAVPLVIDAPPLLNPSTFDEIHPNFSSSSSSYGHSSSSSSSSSNSTFDVLHSWGNLSPMFSVKSQGLPLANEIIPEGCELTQAHLLHRHGSRYPTSGSLPASFATKLHNVVVNGTGFTAKGDLAFLNTWTYKLGAEILTPFGREQLFDLGVAFRVKYGELLKNFTGLPVFRTTSEERMVQSALNFAAGFFGIPEYLTNYRQVISIEFGAVPFNNSLATVCANQNSGPASELGSLASAEWAEVYLQDALGRLNALFDGGDVNLTITDVLSMQELCAYETNALGTSAFCDLFTAEEWKGFEYFIDLSFWYGNGPGNPTSAAVGIGWVQELVSRLTQTPITVANTSTNITITGNSVTFPLDQPIYVDATHDTDISAIVVAMNFTTLNANGPLPTDHIPENQTYFVNQIAPFGSRLVGQVLSCPSSPSSNSSSSSSSQTQNEKYIRWLLNDAVLPQSGISGCPADEPNGLCPLDAFIAAMQTRLGEVDFAFDCNGNYTVPSPDLIVDGRPPADQRPAEGNA